MIYVVHHYELWLYYCIYISVFILCFYKLFEAQNETFTNNPYIHHKMKNLAPGWTFLGRQKDTTDIEWSCCKYFIRTSWLYLMFHFLVTESLKRFNTPIVKHWYLLSSIIFVLFYMGAKQLMLILIQPVIYFIILFCGGKQRSLWMTSLLLLLCNNLSIYKYYIWKILYDGSSEKEKNILLLVAMAWTKLRCISFSLDYVERQEKTNFKQKGHSQDMFQTLIDLFSYILYFPLLFTGPVILYENFLNSVQYKNEKFWPRFKRFALDISLFLLYAFLLELALHYFYFNAMRGDIKLIKQLPTLALTGGGLWMGFVFQVTYVVAYGTASAFARLDGMNPPPTPRCIARIYAYSQMWRYFDVGLYKFLLKYVFKPSFGALSKYTDLSNTLIKLIASLNTFAFICFWHGATSKILIWSALSYCGILIEHMAKAISMTKCYKHFKVTFLVTDAMEVRFKAIVNFPFLPLSVAVNFYMFGGTEVGHVYFELLDGATLHNALLLLLTTYCCSIVSMSLQDVSSRTDVKANLQETVDNKTMKKKKRVKN